MTLPGPDVTHRWQGRTLVDHNGEPAGSIEVIYLDNATGQPEWALLEAAAAGRAPTFVPLVGASDEGDSVRVPFDKALVEGAPSVPADRELSEEEEGELYRHYGVPYSRDDSPSGLPAGAPETAEEPLPADGLRVAGGMASGEPLPAGEPEVAANEPLSASESLPAGVGAGGGALPEAAVPESAPISAGDVPPAPDAAAAGDGLAARLRQLPITDPWVGAGAVALAVAAGIWRRETIGRQGGTAVGRLAAIPRTVSRQRRQRRRAKAINQAVTGATQQTTALARAMARLLTGAALLPVTGAVQGSRRARASVQATRETTRRVGRRLRPSPRRRRRGGKFGMAVGGATGFVLGAKAGRQRYQEISDTARRLMDRPEVKRVTERAVARLDQVSSQAADWLQEARQSAGAEGRRSDGPRMTVVPDAPPVTSPQPTIGPAQDLAPMPPEPTVLPGERASSAERRRPAPPDPLP
jgi:hypothetical protein